MQLMSWKNNTLVSISIEISYFLFSGKGKKKKKSSPMHTQAFIPWTAPQLAANWVLHPHAPHHHRTRRCYVTESQHLFKDLAEPAMWVVQTWSCSILGATSGWGRNVMMCTECRVALFCQPLALCLLSHRPHRPVGLTVILFPWIKWVVCIQNRLLKEIYIQRDGQHSWINGLAMRVRSVQAEVHKNPRLVSWRFLTYRAALQTRTTNIWRPE